jgi:CubicO group peptidase (beta-lactamase class C family)
MMLIEEGKLKLDEPIDLLAPELADHRVLKRIDGPLDDTVPAKRAITLEDVMTFRLGWGSCSQTPIRSPGPPPTCPDSACPIPSRQSRQTSSCSAWAPCR